MNATQMAPKLLSYIKLTSCRTYGLHIKRDTVNGMYVFDIINDEHVPFVLFHYTVFNYRWNWHRGINLVQYEQGKLQIRLSKRFGNKTHRLSLYYVFPYMIIDS